MECSISGLGSACFDRSVPGDDEIHMLSKHGHELQATHTASNILSHEDQSFHGCSPFVSLCLSLSGFARNCWTGRRIRRTRMRTRRNALCRRTLDALYNLLCAVARMTTRQVPHFDKNRSSTPKRAVRRQSRRERLEEKSV